MRGNTIIFFLVFLSFGFIDNLSGEEAVKINRINGEIDFDGLPNESVWESASLFPLTTHKPNFGALPSEKSEVRIGYDDESLWVGADLYMNDVSKIMEATKMRDYQLFGIDAFGIILDTFKDNENGLAFFTTPTGIRTDYTISNDAALSGLGSMNYSWNTFWDVKTTKDKNGWYVEMKIPLSSLKFKAESDIATMELTVIRNISSHNETDTYPAIRPDYGWISLYKPSLAGKISIEGVKPKRPVYISPYLLTGISSENNLNESATEYAKTNSKQLTAGLDIKYNINSTLTLDLTANTDFAQVESDAIQVNITRYSLFFPERRKFFQERTSLFDFSLGGLFDNLFYSRNIGISDGALTKILGGARLTGRIGKTDIGFLEMQTAQKNSVPGENFGVLRLRRQVINQNSYIGGIFTSRLGMNGYKNLAYGVDGIFRLFGNDYLNAKWAQSYDSNIGYKMNSLNPSFFLFDWERRSQNGFAYKLNYTYYGSKFNPASGFVMRGNVQGFNGRLLYGWVPGKESKFFSYNVSLNAERYQRIDDGKLESLRVFPMANFITKKGFHYTITTQFQREGVRDDFNLSDSIKIKAKEYSFGSFNIVAGTPFARKLSIFGDLSGGKFFDGHRFGALTGLVINASSSFNLNIRYSLNAIRFPERATNNSLNIHTVNTNATVMLNTKLSASVMTQYVNTRKELITNFRLRYNPKEGNDFFLVYNDSRGIGNWTTIQDAPRFLNRTIMVKYLYTFVYSSTAAKAKN